MRWQLSPYHTCTGRALEDLLSNRRMLPQEYDVAEAKTVEQLAQFLRGTGGGRVVVYTVKIRV